MSYYVSRGLIPHKRHTQFRKADGSLYHEELLGSEGFSGPSTLVYRLNPPTRVQRMFPQPPIEREVWDDPMHRHHLFRTLGAEPRGDAISGRRTLLFNQDVAFSIVRPAERMGYFFRNAYANELYFVHEGSGTLATAFGSISYRPGDYLVVPHNTLYQLLPNPDEAQRLIVIEAAGYIEAPRRYLNEYGQFLEWAPYSERDLRPPEDVETHDERGEFEVRVKTGARLTSYCYAEHPFDVVGWDGCLYPYALNIEDFEPITGRIHQPPPVHQVFQIPGAVVCNFLPRKVDYHPRSIPAPYNHSNIDSDEVLYYVNGRFLGRKAVEIGSITLHPSGIPHGPKPGGYEGSIGITETDEVAVMLDTFRPLTLTAAAREFDEASYPMAWIAEPASPTVTR
ncbi:MAG: homogentisate 1,2-dioxygenase [Dehalococcoidia bacterium]